MPNKKIVDVAKPDSTPASATSKPIIVGHKPLVADPMVNEEKQPEAETPKTTTPLTGRKLQPLSAEFKKDEPEAKSESNDSPTEAVGEDTGNENSDEDQPNESSEKPEDKLADQEVAIEDERQAKLKELIESKKYNVTFNGSSKNSTKTFFITVITVLLVGAVALLLLDDAGVIDLGLQLPFDLIK